MRIIKGEFKGFVFKPYKHSNTRPTTDLAKEVLFNTIENYVEIKDATILDCFAGTGNIGLEFLSRGASYVTLVDKEQKNCSYIKDYAKELRLANFNVLNLDVLSFFKNNNSCFDIIFADPPYDFPHFIELLNVISDSNRFNFLIIEHPKRLVLEHKNKILKKEIGDTCLSFFKFL